MAEYIEREAAKDAIFEYICGHTMSKFPSKELLIASKRGAEGAMYELDYVPAADVVEVVRCRDCRHYGGITFGRTCRMFSGAYTRVEMSEDGFCSYGERKDGAE